MAIANYPYGIMFHHFHDGEVYKKSQGSIDTKQFIQIIELFGPKNILAPDVWIDKLLKNSLHGGEICLTFDDNLKSQYDIAFPVLESYGIKSFFFVNSAIYTDFIDKLELYRYFREKYFDNVESFYNTFFERLFADSRYSRLKDISRGIDFNVYKKKYLFYTLLDRKFRYVRDEILGRDKYCNFMDQWIKEYKVDIYELKKKLWFSEQDIKTIHKKGHILGLHSHTHPTKMEELSCYDQEVEFVRNYKFLQKSLGGFPISASYPSGSYNKKTLEILRSLGIKVSFIDNINRTAANSNLEIPRENHSNIIKLLK